MEQSMPPDIGALTSLTSLDLSYNALLEDDYSLKLSMLLGLTGTIPAEIGLLTNLRVLRLQGNSLSGPIPPQLGQLISLQELSLQYNMFSGTIHTSLCNLHNLTLLSLSNTNLTGPIPSCISSFFSLSDLSLAYIPLSGTIPESLGNMNQLTSISLFSLPSISGTIPESLGNMNQLISISISSLTSLSGPIPRSLSRLSLLQTLTLSMTNVSGPLPDSQWWMNLTSLSSLDLIQCPLSGPLPQALAPALSSVQLVALNLTGGIPDPLITSMCNASSAGAGGGLSSLRVESIPFEGSFPAALLMCRSLMYLQLINISLTGGIPQDLFRQVGKKLETFDVSNNKLSQWGPGVGALEDLPRIVTFSLSRNLFSGPAPSLVCQKDDSYSGINTFSIDGNRFQGNISRILDRKKGCSVNIDVSSNNITGRLRPHWAQGTTSLNIGHNSIPGVLPYTSPKDCSNLTSLNASSNQIAGFIPDSLLRSCTALAKLDLSQNSLQGPVPRITGSAGLSLNSVTLAHNNLSGPIPPSLSRLAGLANLDITNNFLSGQIPPELAPLFFLSSLNLSVNQLSSSIPSSLSLLKLLTLLSLSHNALSGPIPPTLAPPFLANLSVLDLSSNQLTGPIPWGFTEPQAYSLDINLSSNNLSGPVPGNSSSILAVNADSVADNPYLCGGSGYPDCPSPPAPGGLGAGAIAGIVLGSVLFAAIVGAGVVWWALREKDGWERGALFTFHELDPPLQIQELVEGSGNFDEDNFLGKGGFGSVYRATIRGGQEVAIKRLAKHDCDGSDDFKTEVQMLGRLSHRNVVRLLAAYVAATPRTDNLLVYDYLPGGSLDQVLKENIPENSPFCEPEVRYSVALDVARGLRYLHHNCSPGIIHRDIKPANMLLTAENVAQVADFGLAKDIDVGRTHISDADIMGTAGFVAPEYTLLSKLSFKSDVYAFGVTLIRLISGRNTSDNDILDKGLHRWASSGAGVLDANLRLTSDEELKKMVACVKIGLLCIARLACDRPSMEEVVYMLENHHMLLVEENEEKSH